MNHLHSSVLCRVCWCQLLGSFLQHSPEQYVHSDHSVCSRFDAAGAYWSRHMDLAPRSYSDSSAAGSAALLGWCVHLMCLHCSGSLDFSWWNCWSSDSVYCCSLSGRSISGSAYLVPGEEQSCHVETSTGCCSAGSLHAFASTSITISTYSDESACPFVILTMSCYSLLCL